MIEVIYALWRRDMVKFLRDRRSLITSMVRPFLWLVAFGFGLRASVKLPGAGPDFVSFLVPGMAAMTVLFSSMFAAISIVWEREFGFLKELLVAPIPRGAIVVAKLAAGSATATVEAGLMLMLSPLIGARFSVGGALVSLPLLAVFGMSVNALGHRGRGADEIVRRASAASSTSSSSRSSSCRARSTRSTGCRARCARWC